MEITVKTCLFAKRDVNVYSCHITKVKKNRIILYFCTKLMKLFLKIFFVLSSFAFYSGIKAQGYRLSIHLSKEDSLTAGNTFPYERFYQNEAEQNRDINNEIKYWRGLSYLTCSIDSTWVSKEGKHLALHIGQPIKLALLTYENIPKEILYSAGYNVIKQGKELASFKLINRLNSKILKHYENHGYPFALLNLSNIQSSTSGIELTYTLDPFKKQVFDSIRIDGNLTIKRSFLENYLEIKEGDDYNETAFQQIDRKLKALSFVQVTAPTELYFSNEKAHIIIHTNKRKSDKINGLLGFAPNSNNKKKGLLLTGEFDLELHNLFNSAEEFSLSFKSFLERSQKFETKIGIPYILSRPIFSKKIFSIPIGVEAEFNMFKSDTLFLNLNTKFSLNYLINTGDKLGFYYQNLSTNLISVDTVLIRNTKQLPLTNSVKTNYYGLEFTRSRLDYPFNPRKGLSLHFSGAMGIKRITKHRDIQRLKFIENGQETSIYDSLQLRFNQFNLNTKIDYYLPIGKSSTILFSGTAQSILADKVYANEQIRLGGFGNLRGFDEESIFATSYGLINLEYRYLLGINSYLQLFWNGAYIKNDATTIASLEEDMPFGFGAGISFETAAGIFNIAYALGRQQNNQIDLRTAKIHFGLTGYF